MAAGFREAYFGPDPTAPSQPSVPDRGTRLHLNEMPAGLPGDLRRRIASALAGLSYHRYPEPFGESLVSALAAYYNHQPQGLLVGPGSSSFIRLLLTYFGLHIRGHLVITRPSFAYYEQFCQAYGLPYQVWELTSDFQYDPFLLADLPPYSVVFLTTPNNPTGNVLTLADVQALCRQHPMSLFVVDEAYAELSGQSLLPLLGHHDNLLLLRTFSKAWSAAALRCGALLGDPALVVRLAALQTPWQLTPFTIEAAKVMIQYDIETAWLAGQVQRLAALRDDLRRRLLQAGGPAFFTHPSAGNFLLVQAASPAAHRALQAACRADGLLVSDLGHQPRLAGCTRVTVGTARQNQRFVRAVTRAVAAVSR